MYRYLPLLLIALLGFGPTAHAQLTSATVGDERFRLTLRSDGATPAETEFVVDGQVIEKLTALPWQARIDGRDVIPTTSKIRIDTASDGTTTGLTLFGNTEELEWYLEYQMVVPGSVTKVLMLTPTRAMVLEEVNLWVGSASNSPVIAHTGLQDIAALYRLSDRGMFASLDFPWSSILNEQGRTRVFYPPHAQLVAGAPHFTHSLTLGATRLTGRERYGFDEGEVAAMDRYVQGRHTPRFERPMFASCSINNRFTQPSRGVIFYTMNDHPTLGRNTALLKRELDLMPELGLEYYQVFPGVFDWAPDDPKPQVVDELMDHARSLGVRMGDYSGTSRVFCDHYNDHNNQLDRPEWMMQVDAAGTREGGFCFGNPAFVQYYIDAVVPNAKRFGFEMHCLDFLDIRPCFDATHGHPVGRDSLYHSVRGLVRLLEAINDVAPEMMTWSNSGNWADFLPKIVWSNHNLYLTDPFIETPWQGLNMTRLLDDARREQMVSLHYSRFVPYRFLTNCQYFFSQNSIVPDVRNYQYGALSTLAVTPNLTLGEVRPWLDRQSPAAQREILAFYSKWTAFIREHFDLWKTTYHAGDNPGVGGVEIYSHARGNQGFIFVVNPQYWDATAQIPLDATLGFEGAGRCEIVELHPVERRRLTTQGTTVQLGTTLPMRVAAQQVLVLEVRPAPAQVVGPTLYGLPGSVEVTAEGYRITTSGMQGSTERCAVVLPAGEAPITSATVRSDVPFQPPRQTYPTGLGLLSNGPAGALLEVAFRREPVPTELRRWAVRPGTLQEGLDAKYHETLPMTARGIATQDAEFPLFINVADGAVPLPLHDAAADALGLGPLANFCGGYIENAFGERPETVIDLTTAGGVTSRMDNPVTDVVTTTERPLPELARGTGKSWWLQTDFTLPFMYTIGAEPAFDEHTFLVLPMIRHAQAGTVRAWVNGKELDVRPYRYPRNRSLATWYADLVGTGAHGGGNRLVVHLTFD